MSYSIVIPSKRVDNLVVCVQALRVAGETSRVLVVDDGLGGNLPRRRVAYLRGAKPFCFARNCNIGIHAAGDDDVVLLNDDALLVGGTPGQAWDNPTLMAIYGWGICAATTNVTGYPQQRRRHDDDRRGFREVPIAAFVCVYIPRRTINVVGLLDERFVTYGGEDVDYCLRVREAGLKVGVSDFCYVNHSQLESTFRGPHPKNGAPGDITESNRLGREKWGDKWPL